MSRRHSIALIAICALGCSQSSAASAGQTSDAGTSLPIPPPPRAPHPLIGILFEEHSPAIRPGSLELLRKFLEYPVPDREDFSISLSAQFKKGDAGHERLICERIAAVKKLFVEAGYARVLTHAYATEVPDDWEAVVVWPTDDMTDVCH